MAMETKHDATEEAAAKEVVVSVVAAERKEVGDEPAPDAQKSPKKPALEAALAVEAAEEAGEEKAKTDGKAAAVLKTVSFNEENNVAAEIEDPEKKALDELKQLVKAALTNNEFSPPTPPGPVAAAAVTAEEVVSKPEETKAAEESAASAVEEPPKAVAEELTPPAKEEEAEVPPPADEKVVPVDDDGAKTVEAIEETVIPFASGPHVEAEAPATETSKPDKEDEKAASAAPRSPPEEVFIWGVPLLRDERSDTILLKFLRARDFKVKEAMTMLKNAVLWRKEFGIEALLEEDLGIPEMEKVVFMHGIDKESHPVCYNVYGEFQNKDLYAAAFADEEKRKRFLRWRIQYLEKGIRNSLDFKPGGVSTMVQVTDLKNSIGLAKKELRQALDLLQDNYPEFAAKQVA